MFDRYKNWLDHDSFTKEVAAFEYMKRNPYFISVASLYRLNLYSPMGSSFNPIAMDMKQLLQQIFLYTGFDIDKDIRKEYNNSSKLNYTEKKKYRNYGNMHDSRIKYCSTGENYYYADIYKPIRLLDGSSPLDDCVEISKSSLDAKKENPIDLNYFHENGRALRWLDHLLPSMYIKLNPYMRQDDLKSALVNLIKQINNDIVVPDTNYKYASYATPDAILDDDGLTIDLKSPTFQPLKSLVALIMYDLIHIHKIKQADRLQAYLMTHLYSGISSKVKNEFEKYFIIRGKRHDYEGIKFNSEHKSGMTPIT